ncbi:hypothetical protein, conserved [Eimeria tenella]|uniref:CASP-like protein n=1 Tax=Eimeria tenella TaxID=5802 RepID=U6KZF8_EIMTE|nr:hypothetical protein, conserved [Eimeria tenella]CDJ41714.1 hypothetical protein, conserved [Eimeria tenella]|eukprot:XP_013232464.1 hypothetical protein, conserved [Eimeria tenella]
MMLRYLFKKQPGGGPAPLIHNPVRWWILLLICLHMFLFTVAAAAFAFPSMWDLYCVQLLNNSTYCAVCAAVAFAMIFYFSLLSCETWGTEREWAVATLVTMSMAVADLCTAGWGMLVLVTSSRAILLEAAAAAAEGCSDWKAYFFYYATAVVITAHVTVAISCAAVAVLLTRGVGSQLEELRHLV